MPQNIDQKEVQGNKRKNITKTSHKIAFKETTQIRVEIIIVKVRQQKKKSAIK